MPRTFRFINHYPAKTDGDNQSLPYGFATGQHSRDEWNTNNPENTNDSDQENNTDIDSIFDDTEDDNSDVDSCESEQEDDGWKDDSWDVQDEQVDNSWQSTGEKLDLQRRSSSWIAARLADLEVLLDYGSECELVRVEEIFAQRAAARRAIALRRRRHERTVLVDTTEKLRALLDRLESLDHSQPQVVIDCEGLNFKVTGTIDIMEIFVQANDTLYLLDIMALKTTAWSITATGSTFSMREFLCSSAHKKIMWDLRMDAHILASLYSIQLAGIVDVSLWEVGYRHMVQYGDSFRMSVERACDVYLGNSLDESERESLKEAKCARSGLPPRPWAIRPLPVVLIDYTADVKYMGMLYQALKTKLSKHPMVVDRIEDTTNRELEIVCSPFWDATGDREASSPWSDPKYFETAKTVLQWRKQEAESREQVSSTTTMTASIPQITRPRITTPKIITPRMIVPPIALPRIIISLGISPQGLIFFIDTAYILDSVWGSGRPVNLRFDRPPHNQRMGIRRRHVS